MGKLYTLDNKLLTDTPEIRIGDNIYSVDNRQKTVFKIMKLVENDNIEQSEQIDSVFKLALGEAKAKEIDDLDLPFPAYTELFKAVISAVTGQEINDIP